MSNATEVQIPAAAPSTLAEAEPRPGRGAPSAIASEASNESCDLNPDSTGYDLAAIVRMTPDELPQLAHQPGPVSPEFLQALVFLRRHEGEAGEVNLEDISKELRSAIARARLALNDYEHSQRHGESPPRRAQLFTSLSFALGALNSARRTEKAVRAYERIIQGAHKPRGLSPAWQAVYKDFVRRKGRKAINDDFTVYKNAKGSAGRESFRVSYYRKLKQWRQKL